jgi:hypothetical protein
MIVSDGRTSPEQFTIPLTNLGRIFLSEPFTFLVGKDAKPVYANAAAIADQSESLSGLISNGTAEGKKSAALPDVLEDDFIRVCQFAYTGDYTVVPSIAIEEPIIVPPPSATTDDQVPASRLPKKTKKKRQKSIATSEVSVPQEKEPEMVNGDSTHETLKEKVETWQNGTQEQPSQNLALLEHARLYVFGEQWAIEPLKSLSLAKLAEHVRTAEIDNYFVEKFVDLARYSYSNTQESGMDTLREYVIDVLSSNLEKIGQSGSFSLLLEDGGPLVREFWSVVQKKLF